MFAVLTLSSLVLVGPDRPVDFCVPPGETVVYDTESGPLRVRDLTIGAGGTLRVRGTRPFVVRASRRVQVDGLLELSGFDARVSTGGTDVREPGGAGGPGGGAGGAASHNVRGATARGDSGEDRLGLTRGGGGGESALLQLGSFRRAGDGGGGALAADQPEVDEPTDPANLGLVVGAGEDGSPDALGALSGTPPPRGGLAGSPVFVDGVPANDFWGVALDAEGNPVRGELDRPVGGRGGGGGGDSIPDSVFPPLDWQPDQGEKAGAGGGGGGLGIVIAETIVAGPFGEIRSNGGAGALGQNGLFVDGVGGDGGGGSGGYLVLAASTIDLSPALGVPLSAVGGPGGVVRPEGHGGPGVIQLHTPDATGVRLPVGRELAELSRPDAWSLLLR